MDLDSGATRSFWTDGVELPPTSALTSGERLEEVSGNSISRSQIALTLLSAEHIFAV
jgi:hypothetical protein